MKIFTGGSSVVWDGKQKTLCHGGGWTGFKSKVSLPRNSRKGLSLWVKQATVWARNEGPDKDTGTWGQSLKPSGEALNRLLFLLPQLSRHQELTHRYTTLELKSGILTPQTKWCHFYVYILYDFTFPFSDGPNNFCGSASADSKNPDSAVWLSRQCLPVLGSFLSHIPQ